MKAWVLSLSNDPDQGQAIVFADKATDAKLKIYETNLDSDGWIYIRANRYEPLDNMESASEIDKSLILWKNGWFWYDYETPPEHETTDDEFKEWYKRTFMEVADVK